MTAVPINKSEWVELCQSASKQADWYIPTQFILIISLYQSAKLSQ
jgi:hypothetical protein